MLVNAFILQTIHSELFLHLEGNFELNLNNQPKCFKIGYYFSLFLANLIL